MVSLRWMVANLGFLLAHGQTEGSNEGSGVAYIPQLSCPDCSFNASALMEFTEDYNVVALQGPLSSTATSSLSDLSGGAVGMHGTIALDVRQLKVRLSLHEVDRTGAPPLRSADVHILVDGTSRQATMHVTGPMWRACITEVLPDEPHPREDQLQMIQAMSRIMVRQEGHRGSLDGEDVIVLTPPLPEWMTIDDYPGFAAMVDANRSSLAMVRLPPLRQMSYQQPPIGIKFTNYQPSATFPEAACTIGEERAAQELLSDPEVRAHVQSRLRQLEQHALAFRSIQPTAHVLASIPLNLADIFLPESASISDVDMVDAIHHSKGRDHVLVFSAVVLGLIAAVVGTIVHKVFYSEENMEEYEDLDM